MIGGTLRPGCEVVNHLGIESSANEVLCTVVTLRECISSCEVRDARYAARATGIGFCLDAG